jgi:hypothetical protein
MLCRKALDKRYSMSAPAEPAEPNSPPKRPRGRPRKNPPAPFAPKRPYRFSAPRAERKPGSAKVERLGRISRLLNAGVSIADIAARERLTLEQLRALVREILAGRAA